MTPDQEDKRDAAIHGAIDHVVKQIMRANGFTRLQAVERLEGFAESEREEMKTPGYAEARV